MKQPMAVFLFGKKKEQVNVPIFQYLQYPLFVSEYSL